MTLRVTSPTFPAIYTDYSFQVVLTACFASQFTFSATIQDKSYTSDLGTFTSAPFATSQINESCDYVATYSLAVA